VLDFRHDPGDEEDQKKWNQLVNDTEKRGNLLAWPQLFRGNQVQPFAEETDAQRERCDHQDENEQAPASAQAVFSDEYLA
jgi:hypothetical protein